MANLKIMVGEIDGVEQDGAEYRFNALDQDFSDPTFTATKTKDAIVEARNSGKVFCDSAGHEGSASSGRWLSRTTTNPSDQAPYACITARILKRASLVSSGFSTCTVTIYKDPRGTPIAIGTVSTANDHLGIASFNVSLPINTEVGYKITSGSCTRPSLQVEYET